eukprot:TRINITY_DN51765_c0_g1_i1.p1 TRINITY_DN51765_c0_g1~~TRINITY_DN51765_c0_g1_i1.p1  ORF type:complete len:345 (+),score=60.33 TRINITY_DN51765_c0_g1_i1:53-1036(+)
MSQCFNALMYPGFTLYPLDEQVGHVNQTSDEALQQTLCQKQVVIVGGTSGIGRGIALTVARCGADVVAVGHSASKGKALMEQMRTIAPSPEMQQFEAHAADLLTVKGCRALAAELKKGVKNIDYLVFTVGIWPDKEEPKTADGVDKVLALDVLARFALLKELAPLLQAGSRVMSVLGSTSKLPPAPAIDVMKNILSGQERYTTPNMLATAGTAMDCWLQKAAEHYPGVCFIGTFPGIVATDLVRTSKTFPSCLRPILAAGQGLVALTPDACGRLHAQILTSSNAGRKPVSYFHVPRSEARRTNPLAYDPDFSTWVWTFLDATYERLK